MSKKDKKVRRVFLLIGETLRVETPLGSLDVNVEVVKDVCGVNYQFSAVDGASRKAGEVTSTGDWFDEWTGPRPCWRLYEID